MPSSNTSTSALFTSQRITELFDKVKGHSSVAKLSASEPIPFEGIDVMTFQLDSGISIVAEGSNKPPMNATLEPVTIKPLKVIYQHRVTDEFLKMSDEKALRILETFMQGFSKKIAEGFDIMAMHGLNPYDMTASALIDTNHFDACQSVAGTSDPEADLESAVALIGDYKTTGIALSRGFAADMAKLNVNGVPQYPEFKLGASPSALNGIPCDVNSTVSRAASGATADKAIVGDFAEAFRWGYADEIPMEVIRYGDPDGLGDLKRKNQVVLRAEAYIGWGILDKSAFARVTE